MKFLLYLAVNFVLLLVPCFGQVKISPVNFTGEVIAYIESDIIIPSHSYIPNSDVLIVKVKSSKKTQTEYIKIKTEYFEEKSQLPHNIFSRTGKWKFKVTRRVDCDSVLNPDYSEFLKSANDNKDGDVWIMDKPVKVHFIHPKEGRSISADKVLPCYLILSLKKK